MKSYIKRADIIFLSILFLIGILLILFLFLPQKQSAEFLRVEQNGKEIMLLPIIKDATKTISYKDEGSNTFSIKNRTVSMTTSNCHDKTCIRSGTISQTGEAIVCLPHRLVLTIVSKEENQPDAIAR